MQCGTIASKLQTWRGRRRAVSGGQSGTAAALMHERSSCADGDGPADSRHVQRLVETRSGVGRGRGAKTYVNGFGEGLTRRRQRLCAHYWYGFLPPTCSNWCVVQLHCLRLQRQARSHVTVERAAACLSRLLLAAPSRLLTGRPRARADWRMRSWLHVLHHRR